MLNMVGRADPSGDAALRFRREYERINVDMYANGLPPFPGVEIVDRVDIFSMTRTVGKSPWRVLRPFLLSKHAKAELLLEAIRHETAHAAALLLDDDEDHGPAWRHHARLCGAQPIPTLDEDHALRRDWPT